MLRVRDEPQPVLAWAKGAEGERRLGTALDAEAQASGRIRVLHDRAIPGSRANIDHVAIAGSGVYVIDAKRYTGKVEVRHRGGLLRSEMHLFVGGRDRSKLLDGMERQLAAVRTVVGTAAPIVPVLCFVDSEWPIFARPLEIRGVTITWVRALRKRLRSTGPLGAESMTRLVARLDSSLPPAR